MPVIDDSEKITMWQLRYEVGRKKNAWDNQRPEWSIFFKQGSLETTVIEYIDSIFSSLSIVLTLVTILWVLCLLAIDTFY